MKVGIFGGAFDPVHTEHINIAAASIRELDLDILYVVVTNSPQHKCSTTASFTDRLKMASDAFAFDQRIQVSNIEEQLSDSYSLTLLHAMKRENYFDEKPYFIIGGDSWRDLSTWHKPDEIAELVNFVVVKREDVATETPSRYTFLPLRYEGKKVSSGVVQGELELFRSSDSISQCTQQYVQDKGLYSQYADILAKIKQAVPEKTYLHMARTALYALSFRSRLKLTFRDVFLASMLHDIAKGREESTDGEYFPVQHQFDGALLAEKEFGITDEGVLAAIRTHTTGAPAMSDLQKLIYIADILEDKRDFDGVEALRQGVQEDFSKGFVQVVEHVYAHLITTKKPIHPLTAECLEYYK